MVSFLWRNKFIFLIIIINALVFMLEMRYSVTNESKIFTEDRNNSKSSVLCYVLADPSSEVKSLAVKDTWGSRCQKIIFFSSKELKTVPVVVLPVVENYSQLWAKTRSALIHLYENHLGDYEWFLKADDDTYVVMENLEKFLESKNSSEPVWYGCRLKNKKVRQGFMSGGAGYVLSREALRRVVEEAFANRKCSMQNYGYEDLELGRCLEKVGVRSGDSRDSNGLGRFFAFPPERLTARHGEINQRNWYWNTVWWTHSLGKNCCSSSTITFHKVQPAQMYAMDFLLYQLKRGN